MRCATFRTGISFYEAQEPGLGDYFLSSLRGDIEALKISSGAHCIVYRDYHRALSRVFPYGIFYTQERGTVVVWAIIDLRRDPAWILKHFGQLIASLCLRAFV